eukprot:m.17068 g.17068  ORF g.17068 m.17068 type:complete len:121 (-) comp10641_c0_seq1:106-468(-)
MNSLSLMLLAVCLVAMINADGGCYTLYAETGCKGKSGSTCGCITVEGSTSSSKVMCGENNTLMSWNSNNKCEGDADSTSEVTIGECTDILGSASGKYTCSASTIVPGVAVMAVVLAKIFA